MQRSTLLTACRAWIAVTATALTSAQALAAEPEWNMDPFTPELHDNESLQRGANLYMNFCLGCHSLKYQRYERTAKDLGIPEELMLDRLIFTGQQIGGLMHSSMSDGDARAWFGAPPPDLTMVARVRGPDWIFNFLRAFYVDEDRPFGVNNKVYPNVGMPHALLSLQGIADEVCIGYEARDVLAGMDTLLMTERVPNCRATEVRPGTGLYSPAEYDQAVADITSFLYYVGEPTRRDRYALGPWVIGFLVILWVFSMFLNREFWKDIHGKKRDSVEVK